MGYANVDVNKQEAEAVGRRRRRSEEELQTQMAGNYMSPASQGQIPAAAFLMVGNPGSYNQSTNGEPLWQFPSMANSGLHFMNLPTQQLIMGNGGGGGGGGTAADGHLGMLAALNAFRSSIPAEATHESGHDHHRS